MLRRSPPDGSYVYDTETHLYYLQSRFYNPTIGRFINADALIATGQGTLGNNMFAYCLNDPVNRIDATGTAGIWYYLMLYHDMGFIHRAVQAHIKQHYGAETEFTIMGGRADIKIGTAVWEVKHASVIPVLRIAQAQAQANRYIDGETITELGSAQKFSGNFCVSCGEKAYYVEYSTPAKGVVLYTVSEVQNYEGEYFREFQPQTHPNNNQTSILSKTPASNKLPNTPIHGGSGIWVAAAIAGTIAFTCLLSVSLR